MLKFRFYELGFVVGFRLSSKWDLGFPYFSWFATYPQLRWGFSGLPLSSSCIVVFSLLCSYVPSQTKSCFSILHRTDDIHAPRSAKCILYCHVEFVNPD